MLFKNKISVQKLVQKMYIKRITDQVLHPTYTTLEEKRYTAQTTFAFSSYSIGHFFKIHRVAS